MRLICGNERVILQGRCPACHVVMFALASTWAEMEAHRDTLLESWGGSSFVVAGADVVPPNGDIARVRKIADYLAVARRCLDSDV